MTGRVLFTSPYQPFGGCSPDVYSWNKHVGRVRLEMTFLNHPGLAFLAANVPDVDILEYPTWDEFTAALDEEPVDILGISFYINETELALKMARYARAHGVREIWAGNYGAYSPEIAPYFDRSFSGWGEKQVAAALGRPSGDFVHPPIYGALGTNLFPMVSLNGFLYTSRGCPYTCNYCQTPDFYGKATPVALDAIEDTLRLYRDQGVLTVNVLDENFGIFPAHTRQVISLFAKYGIRWIPLCRVDLMLRFFDEWRDHGLFGAHLGVESLNQESLSGANKRLDSSKTLKLLDLCSRHNMIIQAFYIIGFEDETAKTIRGDIAHLKDLDIDIAQIQVVTPYPRTPLRDEVEKKYGLWTDNLSLYNSRNLVWKHPHIRPEEMHELQEWAHEELFTTRRGLRTLQKVLWYSARPRPSFEAAGNFLRAMRVRGELPERLRLGMRNTRKWAASTWYAYEETADAERLLPHTNDHTIPLTV